MWDKLLDKRIGTAALRSLKIPNGHIDFYSNDYLGLARDLEFQVALAEIIDQHPFSIMGATGSRLISGNSACIAEVENDIAAFQGYEAALLFGSGYQANLSLFSSLPSRGDIMLIDEHVHRSVHDGARLSMARRVKFKHNDLDHLEMRLQQQVGKTIWVAVESLYSMSGDLAPLSAIVKLTQEYGAYLLVDEALAFGVFGYGLVDTYHLQKEVFATTVTYGKAMGLHGASVLGSHRLKEYLINFASPFIYSTGFSDFHALSIQEGYKQLKKKESERNTLMNRINYYRSFGFRNDADELSPVQPYYYSNEQVLERLIQSFSVVGLQCYAVRPPTVDMEKSCIRLSFHAFNSEAEIDLLVGILKENGA